MQKTIILSIGIFLLICSFSFEGKDNSVGTQRANYECSEAKDVNPDKFKIKTNEIYFHFNTTSSPNKSDVESFLWINDNLSKYFLGYLVNTTNETFEIERQDGSLIMIQEALNEDGEWRPIEYWVYSGCGNSYFNPLILTPNKYVMVPIKKYTGSFKTQIRLKLRNRKKTIYSPPFSGSIDRTQFNKDKQSVNGILYQGKPNYLEGKR